ncbi:MAG: DUF3568 family protein [Proteobacteria bacterium]|nr:DUF3568 family protein [Pseudomonadota bacterium]
MTRDPRPYVKLLMIGLLLLSLTGCVEFISAVGTGVVFTTEYVLVGAVTKTISYELARIKKALLVALRRMEIVADKAREVEDGEEITASAGKMEIRVELKQITPRLTRISVRAQKGFMNYDRATAQEIVFQTNRIAESLPSKELSRDQKGRAS